MGWMNKEAIDKEHIKEKMQEISARLKEASRAYYQEDREIMSNLEYDALYDELVRMEQESGIVLSGSPTQTVGYEALSELPKEAHERPMLSLDKTKSVETLQSWLGSQQALLSWKMDGLTIVLTYEGGRLVKAVTRGNGIIGEVITGNAFAFENLPVTIPYPGRLVLRGEAVIRYSDFARINAGIPDADARYKNPRNLCSGSVRQLDPAVTAGRHVRFQAFSYVSSDPDIRNPRDLPEASGRYYHEIFRWLEQQGFDVVDRVLVDAAGLPDAVAAFSEQIAANDIPSDGLVLLMDDIDYGASLGTTAKFPRNSIAFKWSDETAETTLRYIEWSPSRTGLINPVAVFEPVELEGTTVSRASVHNVSILEELQLGEGDRITVYKANMIIPQIAENLTRSGKVRIPDVCPACGKPTQIRQEGSVRTLYCTDPDCPVKKIKGYTQFASRDGVNIDGLSEMTLEKLLAAGCIRQPGDLFRLRDHRETILSLEGFGEKSYENLVKAADTASETTLARFLYGLGIPGIGTANARQLAAAFGQDLEALMAADREQLTALEGVGPVLAESIYGFFRDPHNQEIIRDLLQVMSLKKETESSYGPGEKPLAGMTIVITGSLNHFSNRKELEELILRLGGKTASSVSAKTSWLINNDIQSGSSKNQKAKALGIPILTEEEFLTKIPLP